MESILADEWMWHFKKRFWGYNLLPLNHIRMNTAEARIILDACSALEITGSVHSAEQVGGFIAGNKDPKCSWNLSQKLKMIWNLWVAHWLNSLNWSECISSIRIGAVQPAGETFFVLTPCVPVPARVRGEQTLRTIAADRGCCRYGGVRSSVASRWA